MENLDAIDWRLLDLMQADASLTNQALAACVHVSPPTALRRVARLKSLGLIERHTVLLNPERMTALLGHGLTALAEVTLEQQNCERQAAFEARAVAEDAVQQCYRVSPGPDFVLVLHVRDMPAYLALAQRLFSQDTNVRNVKVFFSTRRAKFETKWPLNGVDTAPPAIKNDSSTGMDAGR